MDSENSYLLPNFLYIGPDKAGSTWIYKILEWHPEAVTSSAKELRFFNVYFDKGLDWYGKHFRAHSNGPRPKVVAEICHDYLYNAKAVERIAQSLPDVRVMACLREPVDRAYSAYLNMARFGMVAPDFRAALEEQPGLLEHGRYATYLKPYLAALGHDRVYSAVYDDLSSDSRGFARALFDYLQIGSLELPEELTGKALPAGRARMPLVSKLAKRGALLARAAGFPTLVSNIKMSQWVQRALNRQYTEADKPKLDPALVRDLKRRMKPDVVALDDLLGLNLVERWGYD